MNSNLHRLICILYSLDIIMESKKKQLIWFVLIALLALSFLFINNRNSARFKNSDQSDLHIQNKISTKNVIKAEPITLPLLENRNDFGKMMESLKGEEMIEIGVQECDKLFKKLRLLN